MKELLIIAVTLQLCIFVKSTEIDKNYLRCLVCRATMNEMETELGKIDPSIEIEVGNYRMDAQGNSITKKVPKARSEIHISETIDEICEKMSDYVRATHRETGKLTILNLMDSSGGMNPEMSNVDLIQDDDLNKSLKYYCEGIVEEFEEPIISLFSQGKTDVKGKLCTGIAKICDMEEFRYEDNANNGEDNKIYINDEL
ncbi:hypothetical protein M0802_010105 [Mischocyttarus mexicanus]|nr:hypothetical protein M0802_010105 [Mischocyttarus mexicanus]